MPTQLAAVAQPQAAIWRRRHAIARLVDEHSAPIALRNQVPQRERVCSMAGIIKARASLANILAASSQALHDAYISC